MKKSHPVRGVLAVVLLLVSLNFSHLAWANLLNAGFEADDVGSAPSDWTVVSSASDTLVVGAEGPAEFAVFDTLETQVAPRFGDRIFRAGRPRGRNESQSSGVNRIRQNFSATSDSLSFSIRVFSFEHRGDDTLRINIEGAEGAAIGLASGAPLTLDVPRGPDPSCTSLPCELSLDVGKSSDTLDSGWIDVEVSGLPVGPQLAFVFELNSGSNEAHPSWAYLDANPNQAPVAQINFAPGSAPDTVAQEGDFVVFDCLDSTDPEQDSLTCSWEVNGPQVPANSKVDGKTVLFQFPDEGQIQVALTVSDGELSDSTNISVDIVNGAPLANALNLEVLEGEATRALCRFLDPGVQDTHTVTMSVDGRGVAITEFESEAVPSLASGFAAGTFDTTGMAPGLYSGQCVVVDNGGATSTEAFSLTVLAAAELDSREGGTSGDQNSTIGAPRVKADQVRLDKLDFLAGDVVDIIELRGADGLPLPAGAEVNIVVHVPADLDAAVLSSSVSGGLSAAPFVSAPFVSAPFVSAPFVSVPFVSAPFVSFPFVSVPFVSAPFVSSPFVSAPFVSAPIQNSPFLNAGLRFDQFPLSQVGLAAPDGSTISGADIDFSDVLPLQATGLLSEAVRVKAISAEFGSNPEHLFFKVGPGEQNLYLAVFSQLGTIASAPYAVQIETSTPPPQKQILAEACGMATPLVSPAAAGAVLRNGGPNPTTLVVTQRERMIATWDMQDYGEFLSSMEPYFNHARVGARVISVPSALFDAADADPCTVAAQNAAASAIKAIIQHELATQPSIKYVQILGSLDIVMPYYTPDETAIGNEALFAQDLWTDPATPLAVAIAEGNNLTDAFYVDAQPQPFRGRELFTEDLPISRLVESPAEMLQAAQTFVANDGVIPVSKVASSGYEFFTDGGVNNAAVLSELSQVTEVDVLINESWSSNDLSCTYLGIGDACPVPAQRADVMALGAHMTYNAALSAQGFNTGDFAQVLRRSDATNLLEGALTVSLGCHSGLSVPDAWALPEEAGLPINSAADWAQDAGDWIGAYTFAYGDDLVADRGTEGINTLVLRYLAAGYSLGEALVRAKWQYGTGLFEFGVYDEKSQIGLALFGMPQAVLAGTTPPAPGTTVASGGTAPLPPDATASAVGSLNLTLLEQGSVSSFSYATDRVTGNKGVWYRFDGQAQGILGRPLLPLARPVELRATPLGASSVHGVALRGGTYDLRRNEDPAFPVQEYDWVSSIEEPQPCVDTMSPTQIASATRFDTSVNSLQSIIFQGGQFQCTSGDAGQVQGDFRIWTSATIEALHPQTIALEDDRQPPGVTQLDLVADLEAGSIVATLDALDNNGLAEIIGLVFEDDDGLPGGPGSVTAFSTSDITGQTGPFELTLQNGANNFLAFQFIDTSGNITWRTLKGALFRGIGVSIETQIISAVGATLLEVEIDDFESLENPYITIDFGDGSDPLTLLLDSSNVAVDTSTGVGTFTADHVFNLVAGDSVTVTVDVVAVSANGSDTATIRTCSDPAGDATDPGADIVGCGFSATGTDVDIDVILAASIDPLVQYRVRLPQSSKLLKYSDGKATGPGKARLVVTETAPDTLRFSFRAGRIGWDGVTPFEFQLQTQNGVQGGAGVGFEDETVVFSFAP